MKKLLSVTMFLFLTVAFTYAQTPDSIRTRFESRYPNTSAKWQTENGIYNAYYSDSEKQQRVIGYDKNGNVVHNRTQLNKDRYPTGISGYYKSNFPTQSTYEVWMEEGPDGNQSYYSIHNNNRYYFDKSGTYMNTKPHNTSDPMHNYNPNTKTNQNQNLNRNNTGTNNNNNPGQNVPNSDNKLNQNQTPGRGNQNQNQSPNKNTNQNQNNQNQLQNSDGVAQPNHNTDSNQNAPLNNQNNITPK